MTLGGSATWAPPAPPRKSWRSFDLASARRSGCQCHRAGRWAHGAVAAHGDDLDAVTEMAALESDPRRFPAWLSEQLGLPVDVDGVMLASIHAVKGREWPHVVVHHVTEGLLPHRLADDIEEERRVFHVA